MYRNLVPILCGVVISLIVVSPHLAFLYKEGTRFQGVYQTFSDDEVYYQARINDVLEGNFSIGNSYILEHQNDPFLQPPVAEWIIALFAFITHLSVPVVSLLGDVVFTFINFLLVFVLCKAITGEKKLSLLYTIAFFILFLSTFGRPVSPQVTTLFLLSGLICMYHLYRNESHSQMVHMGVGLIVGTILFVSPYYATTLMVMYGFLCVYKYISSKNVKKTAIQVSFFLAPFLPLAGLYAVFVIRASKLVGYSDTAARFGLIQTHIPGAFINVAFALLTAILIFCGRNFLSKKDTFFCALLLLAIPILNWQNIITGQSLQFSSHYLLVTVFLIIIVTMLLHTSLQKHSNLASSSQKQIMYGGIAILMVALLFLQKGEIVGLYNSVFNQQPSQALQDKKIVFDWLNTNTKENEVVLSIGGDYDFFIPVYTHNTVYYNRYATLFVMPNSETENRWLIEKLFNSKISKEYILDHQREFWMNRYIDSYQSSENRKKIVARIRRTSYVPSVQIDQAEIDKLYTRYSELQKENICTVLPTYKLNYVLVSTDSPYSSHAKQLLNKSACAKSVFQTDNVALYQITN